MSDEVPEGDDITDLHLPDGSCCEEDDDMDPDEALAQIRACIANAFAKDDEIETGEAANALTLMQGLDEWLSKGGFLPRAWQR